MVEDSTATVLCYKEIERMESRTTAQALTLHVALSFDLCGKNSSQL